MDRETKNILAVLGVAIIVLFLFRPSKSGIKRKNIFSGKKNTEPPKVEGAEDKKFENAVISINAVRSAINNGEPETEVDKLNRMTLKDYGIKVYRCQKSGKLVARDTKGDDIAKEE
jgi:hypothetical protein